MTCMSRDRSQVATEEVHIGCPIGCHISKNMRYSPRVITIIASYNAYNMDHPLYSRSVSSA